jgi:hypothetical protein
MMDQEKPTAPRRMTDAGALALAVTAIPLFVWSAFNADFFERSGEHFIIPFAVFIGGVGALAAAMWAYYHRDAYLATVAGVTGAFWLSYGMLLLFAQRGEVDAALMADGDLRGLLFAAFAVTYSVLWLASIREHWTLGLLSLGMALMFVFLSVGYYRDAGNALRIGGWAGFVTAGLAWYAALAEMLNREFAEPVLPTDADWFRRFHFGAR